MSAQDVGRRRARRRCRNTRAIKKRFDGVHRLDDAVLRISRHRRKQRRDFVVRGPLERREGLATRGGQYQMQLAGVAFRPRLADQSICFKLAQDARQITGVDRQRSREIRRGEGARRMGELVEHPNFGE